MLAWKQLNHPNILSFLGVNADLFKESLCLVSPWMPNGNLMVYIQKNPQHDRVTSVIQISPQMFGLIIDISSPKIIQIASGLYHLHSRNPPIVHGDVKGVSKIVFVQAALRPRCNPS